MSRVHAARPAEPIGSTPSRPSQVGSLASAPSATRHHLGGFDIRPASEGASSAAPTSPNAPIQGFLSWFTGGKSKKPSPTKAFDYYSNAKDVVDGYSTGKGDIHSMMAEDNTPSEVPTSSWNLFGTLMGRYHGLYNQQQQHQGKLDTMDHDQRMKLALERQQMTGNGAHLEAMHRKTLAMQSVNKMFTPKSDED